MSILIFGDSITHGAFDLEKGGWANRLTVFLWKRNFEQTGNCYNGGSDSYIFGFDGTTTEDIIKRFNCGLYNPKYGFSKILFAIGINDTATYENISENQFKENIKKLINESLKYIKKENIFFLELTPVIEKEVGYSFSNKKIKKYSEIIKKVSNETGINFIPLDNIINDTDLHDGIHPNSNGHEKIFNIVKKYF